MPTAHTHYNSFGVTTGETYGYPTMVVTTTEIYYPTLLGVTTSLIPRYGLTTGQNYGYYLADNTGKVYFYDDAYASDNGASMLSLWQSKETDMADQNPAALNQRKTIYICRLLYVDKTASTPIILSVSNDGGITWTSLQQSVGTGSGATKTAYFHPVVSGINLVYKIECPSASADFQWISLESDYLMGGEGFDA